MSTPRLDQKGFVNHNETTEKIIGSFEVDAAPAVNCINLRGNGFTAAVTAAGRYTVTLTNAATRCINGYAVCEIISGAAVDLIGQLGAFTGGAAPTQVIRCMAAAVETDLPVTDRVHFELTVYGNPIDA